MTTPLLSLNSTTLLFLPPRQYGASSVVQIALRAPETTVETIAKFFRAQHDISELVRILVTNHLEVAPLPSPLVIKGPDYTVEASHKPWKFGEQWAFGWGEDVVGAAYEKWTFVFRVL